MRLPCSLVSLALCACAGPELGVAPVPHPAEVPAPDLGPRYALVWGNAHVHEAASLASPKARMRSYPNNAREAHAADVWPVEIVQDKGAWVKVRTLGGADVDHCYRGPSMLNAVSIELYVAREDLAPVVQSPFVSSFADGTALAANAGVAAFDGRALADGLNVPLGANATVGTSYRHGPRFDMRAATQQTRSPVFAHGVNVMADALTSVPVSQAEGSRVTLLTGCMRVDAVAPEAPQLVPYEPVDASDHASSAAHQGAKHFAIGTKLYFVDRRPAGHTVDAMALSLLVAQGDRLCFQRSLADYTPGEPVPKHHVVELCVAAADARAKAQPRAVWPVHTTPARVGR